MWKRLFGVLLSLHLLILAAAATWYVRLPRANSVASSLPALAPVASASSGIDVQVGQQAVNAFLAQALKNQPEVGRILANADVTMGNHVWNADIGIRVGTQVVPFNVTFVPTVSNGNLDLQIANAAMGPTTVTSTLINIVQILPLPHYVQFDPGTDSLQIDLSSLPTHTVQLHAVNYSSRQHALTVLVNLASSG